MVEKGLRRLVRKRLFELGITPEEASVRSGGALPRETIRGLLRGQLPPVITEAFTRALARALDVTEYRVRRLAGLPVEEPAGARTRPHLRLVGNGEP